MTKRAGVFAGLAHVDNLNLIPQVLQELRLYLPDSAESERQRRPKRIRQLRLIPLRLTTSEICRHGNVDFLGMRQTQVIHVTSEVIRADFSAEARIEQPFLLDARYCQSTVIMTGIKQAGFRQRENLLVYRAIHGMGITLLEIGSAAAAYQKTIAGKRHGLIIENVGQTSVRVAGRGANVELSLSKRKSATMMQHAVCSAGAPVC